MIDELEEKKTEKKTAETTEALRSKKKKKKQRTHFLKGQAHVKCTYNNTMISITDLSGGVLGWSSSGLLGFKGAKKATPYAATQVINDVYEKSSSNIELEQSYNFSSKSLSELLKSLTKKVNITKLKTFF